MGKLKKAFLRASKKDRGITLIALVITIVILIILATVAINAVFKDGGLIEQAELAKDLYNNRAKEEETAMSNLAQQLNGLWSEGEIPPPKEDTIEDIKGGEKLENTTQIKDNLGNIVWIPGGFHVAEDSGTNVEDGIVIEDDAGNQFVWIPVGTYHTATKGDKTNNLSRRSWGAKNVVQDPTEVSEDSVIDSDFYGEGATQDKEGQPITTVANEQIGAFKTSATSKGGFYIGRYEQGEGNVCKAGVNAYTGVTRDEAKEQSEKMYEKDQFVVSELISSYAWDTALNFMCQNSEQGYKLATTTDETYGNIGTYKKELTGAYTADKYSNICDVLGNCYEWTTEYSSGSGNPCVDRGGYYNGNVYYAADRINRSTSSGSSSNSFRLQLYVK